MAQPTDHSEQTRRTLLRLASSLGAASLLAMSTDKALAAKASKASVGYQDTPKADHNCANCSLFQSPNVCKTVDGDVSPNGWCRIWVKKAA